jgi:hypothetical protein
MGAQSSAADPDLFYTDPDHAFHFDTDPDLQFDAGPDPTVLIRMDPDPRHPEGRIRILKIDTGTLAQNIPSNSCPKYNPLQYFPYIVFQTFLFLT